jgi:hypothetical protein
MDRQHPFSEVDMPELVAKTKEIFWEHIYGKSESNKAAMKSEGILSLLLRDIPEHAVVNELRKDYPFLSKHLYLFNMRPGFVTLVHLDGYPEGVVGQRPMSINIPIRGCTDLCTTEFFDMGEDEFYVELRFGTRVPKPNIELPPVMASYCLQQNKPMIIDTQVPHRVNNLINTEYRTSVSWTITPGWTLEKILDFVKNK